MRYSVVIPVYNRPDELDELLGSLSSQSEKDFEVVVVEDGSTLTAEKVCEKYSDKMNLRYFFKENGGPGPARNYGVEKSEGEFVIILDSDCVLPDGYLEAVTKEIDEHDCDAFGGPDAAHESFTDIQKAISYSMTSFFTTGGIRGGKKKLDKFYPRSFNMGIKREVYMKMTGFSNMRFGEDIDFSYRILENGYTCRLFPEAWVWHKRRTDLRKFFKQVFNSGIARINLEKRHPGTMKLVHTLPMLFTVGVISLVLLSVVLAVVPLAGGGHGCVTPQTALLPLVPLMLYALLIFSHSAHKHGNLWIGVLCVAAAYVQLVGYGLGFLKAWWLRCVLGKSEFAAFERNFYD